MHCLQAARFWMPPRGLDLSATAQFCRPGCCSRLRFRSGSNLPAPLPARRGLELPRRCCPVVIHSRTETVEERWMIRRQAGTQCPCPQPSPRAAFPGAVRGNCRSRAMHSESGSPAHRMKHVAPVAPAIFRRSAFPAHCASWRDWRRDWMVPDSRGWERQARLPLPCANSENRGWKCRPLPVVPRRGRIPPPAGRSHRATCAHHARPFRSWRSARQTSRQGAPWPRDGS